MKITIVYAFETEILLVGTPLLAKHIKKGMYSYLNCSHM